MKAVLDSDVLIDYLQGAPEARKEIRKYTEPCYSVVSWMEVMCGAETPDEASAARRMFEAMTAIDLSAAVAGKAVEIRKANCLKLPDAVILASADVAGCILVTRNTKDFNTGDPRVRIPYKI